MEGPVPTPIDNPTKRRDDAAEEDRSLDAIIANHAAIWSR
jgi:hypothetical protein